MPDSEPTFIRPYDLARTGARLAGRVAASQMPRLRPVLVGHSGDAAFTLGAERDDSGQVWVRGTIRAELCVVCQRCLAPMTVTIAARPSLLALNSRTEVARQDAKLELLILDDQRYRVSDLIEDELILALPDFPAHESGGCEPPDHDGTAPAEEASETTGSFSILERILERPTSPD